MALTEVFGAMKTAWLDQKQRSLDAYDAGCGAQATREFDVIVGVFAEVDVEDTGRERALQQRLAVLMERVARELRPESAPSAWKDAPDVRFVPWWSRALALRGRRPKPFYAAMAARAEDVTRAMVRLAVRWTSTPPSSPKRARATRLIARAQQVDFRSAAESNYDASGVQAGLREAWARLQGLVDGA